jgi:hypothetical protein
VERIGVAPQAVVEPGPDGVLRTRAGEPVEAPYVAAPGPLAVAGELVATVPATEEQHGLAVWRTDGPARLAQRVVGLRPNGDLHGGERALIRVYACGRGALELTLLGKQGAPTRILVRGEEVARRAVPSGAVWRPSVPAPASADGTGTCVFELRTDGLVGSTRIEFVRAG